MANVYNVAMLDLANGDLDLDAPADLRMLALLAPSPVFVATHSTLAAVLADAANTESSNAARTALAGETTVGVAAGVNAQANTGTFTSVAVGETLAGVVIYVEGASDALRVPVCFYDLAPQIITNGGDVEIRWNAGVSSGTYLTFRNA